MLMTIYLWQIYEKFLSSVKNVLRIIFTQLSYSTNQRRKVYEGGIVRKNTLSSNYWIKDFTLSSNF